MNACFPARRTHSIARASSVSFWNKTHANTHTQCTFRLIVSLLLSLPLPSSLSTTASSSPSLLIFRSKRHRHTKNYAFNMLWYTRFSGMSTTYAKKIEWSNTASWKPETKQLMFVLGACTLHTHINWSSFVGKENMQYEKQLSENMSGISWKTKKDVNLCILSYLE